MSTHLLPSRAAESVQAAAPAADGPRSASPFGPELDAAEIAHLPAKLLWTLVAWYRAAGELDRVGALLDEIEGRGGETVRLLEEGARLSLALGDAAAAISLMERRVARSPSPSARVALARLLLETGDHETAATISREVLREAPDLATVRALAADVARAGGDLASARDHYEVILAKQPESVAALLGLARLAIVDGNWRGAGDSLDAALTCDGLTVGQLTTAGGLAELADRPALAMTLRHRLVTAEIERGAALAAAVDQALGRPGGGGVAAARLSPARPTPVRLSHPIDAERGAAPTESPTFTGIASHPPAAAQPAARPATAAAILADEARDEPPAAPDADDPPATAIILPDVPVEDRVRDALRSYFGHDEPRPGQAAVIASVLAGRDTLAIMPTGAGKSLTFQLPAMLLERTTLVISPLIALMKDQVDGLPPAVREQTALLNSTLSAEEQHRVLDGIADGAYKLVYAAPERLRQGGFLRALRTAGVSLVVVDEAHCISLWGHDFRPDYLGIPSALPELGDPPLLALTATATKRMERGIEAGFGRPMHLIRISLFRPNLYYEVDHVANREEKVARVVEICRRERGAGIVYVSSRRDTEQIAGLLRDRGVGAIPYHAGLDPATRARNQERFMSGQVRVVVATVAFGMGVDKDDVRFIVHLNPPRSLESYSQESGRAGRDGTPARCVLLVSPTDQKSLNSFARRDELDLDTLRRVYASVQKAATGRWALVDPGALLSPQPDEDPDEMKDPRIALGLLEQADLLRRYPDAPVTFTVTDAAADHPDEAVADPLWDRFATRAGFGRGLGNDRGGSVTVRTAETCEALGVTPVELGRLLGARAGSVREGPCLVCLELLPAGNDAAQRLNAILVRARKDARARVQRVIDYAAGDRCRHVVLATHLNEALDPCGVACDVCTGAAVPAGAGLGPGRLAQRSRATAEDALAVLAAVRSLPFPMGKTGLGRLLLGSVESRVRADRSPAFGALAELKKGTVDGLIDRLAEEGFLYRDMNHEFKLISVTERGEAATLDDLAGFGSTTGNGSGFGSGSGSGMRRSSAGTASSDDDDLPLDAEAEELLERLRLWRRERAGRDGVSAFIVAPNSALAEIARFRPTTPDALGEIKGFGPNRVEKYGAEILGVVEG